MLRHAIAPTRFFTQISNDIIRHPRLSSDAKCLLTWQLSLPPGADEPLSVSAERAGIKKTAFIRAKRELKAEGYVHEWRRSGPRGRWSTTQLVSNVPLTEAEALAVRDGGSTSAPPTAAPPAVGEPTPRAVGRSQENNGEDTPHPPHPLAERGAAALAAVSHRERRLRLSGRDIRALAPIAGQWFERGATLTELHEALTAGLPDAVRSPAGITRDRLLRKMPDPLPEPAPAPPPLRACAGGCGRMIRPAADETRCRDCRLQAAEAAETRAATADPHDVTGAVEATRRGVAAIRKAMSGAPAGGPRDRPGHAPSPLRA
ncbi:hypothetical protein LE181_12560 [Streptomyces sp. SCA3-4]|uniref:hypothetical protein n=1 Tax=Streptomyces sichuanensis TaxID=2871810 RepID=UPI001CE23E13|nr:hypothetical protein [Streptomyces sichuanensis]MCA6092989.1 hypothetical protein [Streptomyces sichuanensis]